MSRLVVDFLFPAAPITTLLKRIEKGIEQFYYAEVFARSPAYEGSQVWRDWLEMGFHVAIVSAPPGTLAGDRVHLSVRAPSATPVVTVEGANGEELKRLESLLLTVDGVRTSLVGAGEEVKAEALVSGPVADQLVRPVVAALDRDGLSESEIDQYRRMLRRGFLALTHDSIKSISVILS
jgi:hypothetical protein